MTNDEKVIAEFNEKVLAAMQPIGRSPGLSRLEALNSVKIREPKLAQAYLLATNPGKRQTRELTERFDMLNLK